MAFFPEEMIGIEGIMKIRPEAFFDTPDGLLDLFREQNFFFFILWNDRMFCCDRMNDWAFADVEVADDTGNPNSAWKIVTPGFASLSDALDFPFLDGKSVRERFAECRFFVE